MKLEADASRIPMNDLPPIFTIARDLALNLHRTAGFNNIVQAQRFCRFGLDSLSLIFRRK